MRKLFLIALLALFSTNISHAQRFTDELDRGVVAVNLNGQVFVSWRILPEEYYGTTYNLYKNGYISINRVTVICLGSREYSVEDLFKNFEYLDKDGNWNVFGA